MRIVQYDDWKIEVDIERTKKYYEKYEISNTQYNRNFAEYCKNLTKEEKEFFDNFGINPLCCEVSSNGLKKNGILHCYGFYYVCGNFLEYPKEKLVLAEEFLKDDFVEEYHDDSVYAGIFKFNFQCEKYLITLIPADIPKGFICIMFSCDLKWLLKEKCKEKAYYPPRFWELHNKIYYKYRRRKLNAEVTRKNKNDFISIFDKLGIEYEELGKRELKKYKMVWIREFCPSDYDIEELKKICIINGNYLWHIFSYEILKCYEKNADRKKFDSIKKEKCIIFSSRDNFAYKISNFDELKANVIDKFLDVVITDVNFSWTYAKTHEFYLGPYFYKK